jgi:hypothetical protein
LKLGSFLSTTSKHVLMPYDRSIAHIPHHRLTDTSVSYQKQSITRPVEEIIAL